MSERSILDTIAIIPARGGSKRIPRKNTLPVAGRPLVAHTIDHARRARMVGAVYVTTDDDEIAAIALGLGAKVIRRPAELSDDKATSESALLHVLDTRKAQGLADPDLVVFLQCTSPVRRPDDIDKAVAKLVETGADSLFSAHRDAPFVWSLRGGSLQSITYDYLNRGRTQDREPQYVENGSIFVLKPSVLRSLGNRLGGRIAVYEMDYWCSFDIDTPDHVEMAEHVLRRPQFRPPAIFPESVQLVVFDFDGVMTDNTVLVGDDGQEHVRCNRSDGLGIDRLRHLGVKMIVLSTEKHPVVGARCRKLNIECHHGVSDKAEYLARYLESQAIDPRQTIYLGNDENDLGCLALVGMPVVVSDAHPAAIAAAEIVLTHKGGNGAVRELCDLLAAHLARPIR